MPQRVDRPVARSYSLAVHQALQCLGGLASEDGVGVFVVVQASDGKDLTGPVEIRMVHNADGMPPSMLN
jgi:hypothetical protein